MAALGAARGHAFYRGIFLPEQGVGAVLDPAGDVGIGGAAVGRIVFEPAVVRRVVRGSDDDAVGQAVGAAAIVDEDGMGDDGSGGETVMLLEDGLDAIGGEDFEGGVLGGALAAWVSLPMKTGPVIFWAWRYSQMAWVMARMWASVNVPSNGVPRWPLVPKRRV